MFCAWSAGGWEGGAHSLAMPAFGALWVPEQLLVVSHLKPHSVHEQYFRVCVLCAAGSILALDVRGRRLEESVRPPDREGARMPTCLNKMGLSNTRARQHPFQVCSLFSPVHLYYKEVLQDENLELEAKIKIERTG